MRVRNAKACHVSLGRFGKLPTGETLMVEIESVSLAPGETQDVDDEFFASEGAKEMLADGTLVDVMAEAERAADAASSPVAGGDSGGEPEPATNEEPAAEPASEPEPATNGRKRRGGAE